MLSKCLLAIQLKKNNIFNKLDLYKKSINLTYKVNPNETLYLVISIIIRGLTPAISITTSYYLINIISSQHASNSIFMIYLLILVWSFSLLINVLLNPWILNWQNNLADCMVNHINIEIIKKTFLIKNHDFFDDIFVYDDLNQLKSYLVKAPTNFIVNLLKSLRVLVIVSSSIILLFTYVHWISLFIIISACIIYKVFNKLQKYESQAGFRECKDSREMQYLSNLAVDKNALKEITMYQASEFIIKKYHNLFTRVFKENSKLRFRQSVWSMFPLILALGAILLTFYIIINMTFAHQITIGALVLFIRCFAHINENIVNLSEQSTIVEEQILFFEKFFKFIDLEEKDNKLNNYSFNIKSPPLIQFQNVSFEYINSSLVLDNINFTIFPNEKIAIVGSNGAGKTTLIKLLCGLYKPTQGKILINGIDLESINLDDWQKIIAPVFQEFCKYNFTIRENITFGRSITDNEFELLIKETSLPKSVLDHCHNLTDKQLGNSFGGIELSGGQWQQLAISRARFKTASIYILDEANSSLDFENENKVCTFMKQAWQDKTVLFITHRLTPVYSAERIFFLDKGKLIAEGTHDKLLIECESYKKLYKSRMKKNRVDLKTESSFSC